MYPILVWCKGIGTHNQLVRKQTLNHLAKPAKWLSCVVSTYLYGAFDYILLSCQCTRFRVNLHSTVAWISRNSLLETGVWLSLKLQISHQFQSRKSLTFETSTWHDNNIQSNLQYRKVLTTQLNHLVSLAKWLSVFLRAKWLWVQISLLSHKI